METVIIGVGFLSPSGVGLEGFQKHLENPADTGKLNNCDPQGYLGNTGLKFVGSSTLMYSNLAYQCLAEATLLNRIDQVASRIGLYDGSELANIEEALLFDLTAKVEGSDYVSPMKAPNTLANASASFMGIKAGITGVNMSVSGGSTGFFQALDIADLHLNMGITDFALVASVDSSSIYQEAIYRGMGMNEEDQKINSVGVGVLIAKKDKAQELELAIYGRLNGAWALQKTGNKSSSDLIFDILGELKKVHPFSIDKMVITGLGASTEKAIIQKIKNGFPEVLNVTFFREEMEICDSTSGGLALLQALLQRQKMPTGKSEKYLLVAIDPLGYVYSFLVTI